MINPRKFYSKLRLAYPPKAVQDKNLLSTALPLWKKRMCELCRLRRSVDEFVYFWDAFETEIDSKFSNVCLSDLVTRTIEPAPNEYLVLTFFS